MKRSVKLKLIGGVIFLAFIVVTHYTHSRLAALISGVGWLIWFIAALMNP